MGEAQFLCVGDLICLYCEETNGFVYSDRTSSTSNGIFAYHGQERDHPDNLPNVHVITFQVITQNRYKLTKKYRKLQARHGSAPKDRSSQLLLSEAKLAAEAENKDNIAEQNRMIGKQLRYGEIVQLRHVFTDKFIQISTTETSKVDKNKMLVHLSSYNSKHAQFRINPRCKVKAEGEPIEIFDQVVIESVKSLGTFLHSSDPYQLDRLAIASELNLGVDRASFTVMRHYQPSPSQDACLRGGSVIQLFHKDLEAYLVAEGVFGEDPQEDVHLRIREINTLDTRTLRPPRSGITYWQVEVAESIVDGRVISWEEQVRLRHMTTRLYLCISEDLAVSMTSDRNNPGTVFTFHSLSLAVNTDYIHFGSNARVAHMLTDTWLHGPIGGIYEKKELRRLSEDGASMSALHWDNAHLIPLEASPSRQYPDAFTVQEVAPVDRNSFNYVAGLVPFIRNLTAERRAGDELTSRKTIGICEALTELKDFTWENGQPTKTRQKLLRNLRMVDLLVEFLQCPMADKRRNWQNQSQIMTAVYQVLHAYTWGRTRKNALYFAKYIDFFETQLGVKAGVGLQCCIMLIELVRDNRKIVDRIKTRTIKAVIKYLKQNQHYRYLELLGMLSVCNGIAITDNQTHIAVKLLENQKDSMYHVQAGQDIERHKDVLYVSTDNRESWVALHKFVYKSNVEYEEEKFLFLDGQLELYKKLCYGRNQTAINVITRSREYLTWEVAFLGLMSEILPDRMRAKFCGLIIGLFVDVGENYSVIEVSSNNFLYSEVSSEGNPSIQESASQVLTRGMDAHFPALRVWLEGYFAENTCLVASQPAANILMEQVLRLLTYLIQYGYMSPEAETEYTKQVVRLINGWHDVPFPPDLGKEYSLEKMRHVLAYRYRMRFLPGEETDAMILAKLQALELLELLLIREFNRRIKQFVSAFKDIERHDATSTKKKKKTLARLLQEDLDSNIFWKDQKLCTKTDVLVSSLQRKIEIFGADLPRVIFDLTYYRSDDLLTKALTILNRFNSSITDLLSKASRAQLLISMESCRVHREALKSMVKLRNFTKSKLDTDRSQDMCRMFQEFANLCHVPDKPDVPHTVGQDILVNNGALEVIMDVVMQEVDTKLEDRYAISRSVISQALTLLKFLAQGNDFVQKFVFSNLDNLMSVEVCGPELAMAVQEAFIASTRHCLLIQPKQMRNMVRLVGLHRERAPEFLQLLRSTVKIEAYDMVLKRNQFLATKLIMENYKTAAYVMDVNNTERLKVLIGKRGDQHRQFLINLVDLLAACAEGEGRYIESLCQTLLPVEELLSILNNRNVSLHVKAPFARYLVWAYTRTARTKVESGVDELDHDSTTWKHIQIVWTLMKRLVEKEGRGRMTHPHPVHVHSARTRDLDSLGTIHEEPSVDVTGSMDYLLNGGLLFIQAFFSRFYQPDNELFPEEADILKRLVNTMIPFCDVASKHVTHVGHMTLLTECLETLLNQSGISRVALERVHGRVDLSATLINMKQRIDHQNEVTFNKDEVKLNEKLHTFTSNVTHFVEGKNSLAFQLHVHTKGARTREYVLADDAAKLPLGQEFQAHTQVFISQGNAADAKYHRAFKLIDQLAISARRYKQQASAEQEALDLRSLQILRAMIYNLVVQLPDGWESYQLKYAHILDEIRAIQNKFCHHDIIKTIMQLLARRNPAFGNEVLALVYMIIFNANRNTQEDLLAYFKSTAEEVFFLYVRNRLQVATMAMKERRSMEAQHAARQKQKQAEGLSHHRNSVDHGHMNGTVAKGDHLSKIHLDPYEQMKADRQLEKYASKKKSLRGFFRRKRTGKLVIAKDHSAGNNKEEYSFANPAFVMEYEEEDLDLGDYDVDGGVALVMKVLAGLCDGQYRGLQNYLRTQPDNVRSVNLVSEVTQFITVLYSHVTKDTIDMLTQVFATLNEVCQGNQENRTVVMNNKIVDYINFILRMSHFEGCTPEQVLELRSVTGVVLQSLTEEMNPDALVLAREVKDTIDIDAMVRVMTTCYTLSQDDSVDAEYLLCHGGALIRNESTGSKLLGIISNVTKGTLKTLREPATDVTYMYYLVLRRFIDLEPSLERYFSKRPDEEMKALNNCRDEVQSIEVVKDDHLQKINFRVRNTNLLREEVKEQVKWDIDRTSPSAKLRDLISWSRDILHDIDYQKKILNNPFVLLLAKRWAIWNYLVILLSLAINIMMLVTWDAPLALDDIEDDSNMTDLPDEIYDIVPKITWGQYYLTLYIMGGIHNACSVMLFLSYMLLNHPSWPDFSAVADFFRKKKGKEKPSGEIHAKKPQKRESKLEVKLLSAITAYYTAFVALSFAGTFLHGYFFAFHLLNIVANNQLLKGVIKAVTLNGMSLLWVGVMGMIVIYLFALVGFAFFRSVFDPEEELYCDSLVKCTVTVLRYGLIGDIGDLRRHELENSFRNFGFLTIYQVAFFIIFTTIGLNIIFGIIVDTFSELRDLKWTAEKDMRDCCLICGRDSYDFEHSAQGFQHHVRNEHSMWAYVFYFIYLREVKRNDLTALDMYVSDLLRDDKLDFFPMNQALSLAHMGDDSTENKIDDVMKTVEDIRKRQEEEEHQRRREQERQRQMMWAETYRRHHAFRSHASSITDSPVD